MMYTRDLLQQKFAIFNNDLIDQMFLMSKVIEVKKGDEILRVGQYVNVIPIVLSGLVKVYTFSDDKEFLLYYIKEYESCIMSFTAGINHDTSQINAVTEENSTLLLLPSTEVIRWSRQFPEFTTFYLKFYQNRYQDIIDTLRQVVFDKLDQRVLDYLKIRIGMEGDGSIKITHKEISKDLATSREVVTRIIKKLENDHKIILKNGKIKII
jgi:CRP/FNR family transcriptional regulator, anaerobic regulatory protein